ncbi:hypothetical protein KAI87_13555, partial [Myxococcota bacterium]|nr:hypothetical protein [Myxococcota bacterium]
TTQLRWEPGPSSDWSNWELPSKNKGLRPPNIETGLAIGIRLNKLILRTTLALGRVEITDGDDYYEGYYNDIKVGTSSDTRDITFVTPSLSGQYYFYPPSAGGLVPFVIARFGRTLAFLSESSECTDAGCPENSEQPTEQDKPLEKAQQDLLSPWQISFGGGGDYFISKNVSLGMETGLRFSYVSGAFGSTTPGDYYYGNTFSFFDFLYGVVTLNFFWV